MIIAVYDPQTMNTMMDTIQSTAIGEAMGDQISGLTSLLGMLGGSFYGMIGVILAMVYVIITANSLIATQVDRGSMAYTLSTPIKRSKVGITQAIYMILSIVAMFALVTVFGLVTAQVVHNGIVDNSYPDDIVAAASVLGLDEEDVDENLNRILEDEEALREGAKARDMEEEVYAAYLSLKQTNQAYEAAAEVLEVEADEVSEDPSLMLEDDAALRAAARVMDMDEDMYRIALEESLAQQAASAEQAEAMQNQFILGIAAAAEVLNMELSDLTEDLGLLKTDDEAMMAAVTASQIPEESFVAVINQQLAASELALDSGLDFEVGEFLLLNVGACLLLFAISSISFASSCIFNLSKYSMTIGAGLPMAFFVFQIMAETSESLEAFKYLSLNTLFDPSAITGGGTYGVQFAVLGAIGVVLYVVGVRWFEKKDLPL
ncbi:MAG: hypothetical protein LIO46_07530 [Clostridiales bacterium]|nr:hypothetical protein [Clostridiales bacterium]